MVYLYCFIVTMVGAALWLVGHDATPTQTPLLVIGGALVGHGVMLAILVTLRRL